MKHRRHSTRRFASLPGIVAACTLAAAFGAVCAQVDAQGRGGRSDSGASQRDSAPQRGGSPQRGGAPQGEAVHARREVVKTREPASTPRYVPPPSIRAIPPRIPSSPTVRNPRPVVAASARPPVRESPVASAQRAFTKTPQGRRYDNGLQLRHGIPVQAAWQRRYFTHGRFHYPYYCPTYNSATAFISPFGFYFGVCAPFVLRTHCYIAPPPAVFIDVPIFVGDTCQGYAPIDPGDNYLDLDALRDREPGLANAVDELREAFGRGDVDALAALVDPNTRIAIFERGRYQYSLAANDFVDMTRDAIQSLQTISFDITMIHERSAGVYVVSGEHVYTDRNGNNRRVYVSYVVEDLGGVWTLTQVGTAPDRNQAWQ